jgi:hypothetical protein
MLFALYLLHPPYADTGPGAQGSCSSLVDSDHTLDWDLFKLPYHTRLLYR